MPTPTASVLDRVAPDRREQLHTPLSAGHANALRTMLNAGLLRPKLDKETEDALIAAGYARTALGGTMLTEAGEVRAMMENGQ